MSGESTQQTPAAGRRNRVIAFLLNLIVPPAGYVYAGSARAAVITVIALIAFGVLVTALTWFNPPGVYADQLGLMDPGRRWIFQAAVGAAFGAHAAFLARRQRPRRPLTLGLWALAVLLVVIPLGLAQALRTFAPISVYSAASASMNPTLEQGDVIGVRGARFRCGGVEVRAGDLVVFAHGAGSRRLGRAVAGPGQTVAMQDGRLSIDGKPVATRRGATLPVEFGPPATVMRETLPNGVVFDTLDRGPDGFVDQVPATRVPAGAWFVMGDNRDNAVDSRVEGPVPANRICGVAIKVLSGKHPGARP